MSSCFTEANCLLGGFWVVDLPWWWLKRAWSHPRWLLRVTIQYHRLKETGPAVQQCPMILQKTFHRLSSACPCPQDKFCIRQQWLWSIITKVLRVFGKHWVCSWSLKSWSQPYPTAQPSELCGQAKQYWRGRAVHWNAREANQICVERKQDAVTYHPILRTTPHKPTKSSQASNVLSQ